MEEKFNTHFLSRFLELIMTALLRMVISKRSVLEHLPAFATLDTLTEFQNDCYDQRRPGAKSNRTQPTFASASS